MSECIAIDLGTRVLASYAIIGVTGVLIYNAQ